MRAAKLQKLLAHAMRHKLKVLIKGKPGVGKSDVVAQACLDAGYELMIEHASIADPTDPKGLPMLSADGKGAEFVPFKNLRRMLEATKPTLVFFDDIGQATPAVQASIMQLILARRLNDKVISEHVLFMGATNDTNHCAGVSGMIEPLKSRFDTIVEFEVSTDDWSNWALDNGLPEELIAFIRFRPALLSDFKPSKELKNSPSPRGWFSIAKWLKTGFKDLETFAGAVGEGAATEFYGFLDMIADLPSLDGIILDPVNSPVPSKPGALFAVASGLARKSAPGNFDRVTTYLARLPKEFEVCAVRDAQRLTPALVNTRAFVNWASKNGSVLS